MTTALRDCLGYHFHNVETGNECYRFHHRSATARTRGKVREHSRCSKPEPGDNGP